jgi:hypothetical protein
MALRINRLPNLLEPAAIPLESGDGNLLKKEKQVEMMSIASIACFTNNCYSFAHESSPVEFVGIV